MKLTPPETPDATPMRPSFVRDATETAAKPEDESEKSAPANPTIPLRYTIVEPAVFLVYVSTSIATTVLQNQQLYQTCVAVYDYEKELCEPMLGVIAKNETSIAIETEIQPYVAKILMATSVISSVLPAFLSLFIGPWSDKFGRRPALLATFGATFIGHLITTILAGISVLKPFNPWVYLLSSIPLTLTGGTCVLMTMVFCLVSDVSDEGGKAKRLFLVEGSLGLGFVIGNLTSSYVLAWAGTIGVFAVATVIDLLAFLYLIFFIAESLQVKHERKVSKIREFFNFDLIKDLVHSCVRSRPNYNRAVIWSIMFTLTATTFVSQGEGGLSYLFLRNKFNVTLQEFTTFNAAALIIKMFGCALALVVLRMIFKVPLIVVAILGLLGSCTDSLIRAFAQQFWQMYLASVCGFIGGINIPMLQAILAGLVEATEIGKIYAVISSLQTVSPLVSAPIYTAIYNATLVSYAGAIYFLSAGIYLLCFVMITVLYNMQLISARKAQSAVAA